MENKGGDLERDRGRSSKDARSERHGNRGEERSNNRGTRPTRTSESSRSSRSGENKGGDRERDCGRLGKDDEATAGYTSANDVVHNTGSNRQGKPPEPPKNKNKNKDKNVPPKSTSHQSQSSHVEDRSGGADGNKNGRYVGDDGKMSSGGGGDGSNGIGSGSGSGRNDKDKHCAHAGFSYKKYGYHDKIMKVEIVRPQPPPPTSKDTKFNN